jgi:pyrroloquinoline quinone biosynthesis protein E
VLENQSKHQDFGGCRCQAFLFNGDINRTDPVGSKSPQRHKIDEAIAAAREQAL